ncbi:ATP-binding cassette domain-containing protein [Modestobacter sp. I12A-02628]|uniref:ABC transporter ATP-binding protein n=1 Tax=Goekera deserti TaxID=2497753 RepID=A0A7K3WFX9_9ACTN|nr:ABC transporter ATP-binding protein [Goekera deserti]MPQ96496.1 ATP-binding cassette domain-containing protein [Goekera deserti]NDI47189.1 ATP-binding cassette domain-containing protein [Goekera deserti]NEL55411.1 ABC transporter ATP-binding protein [Goekera deserti]
MPSTPVAAPPAHLRIDRLTLEFGGVRALSEVSIDLAGGGIIGLIGPNGAGKTSLLNCISGFYRPTSGDVTLDGRSVLDMRRHQLAGQGIARTFQNLALFGEMSVYDNVAAGAPRGRRRLRGVPGLRPPGTGAAERDAVWAMLERFDLVQHARHPAHGLPFGTLKRVEFARALMARPRVLLLDEPAGGLTHTEVDELGGLITDVVRDLAPVVLLIEHHMGLILSVCSRIVVMDSGRTIADGPTEQVRHDPAVISAYLGGGADLAAR